MPPTNSKANYKSYQAQARLVRAIVAAHPEVKWNYKEIVACYGSDMTEHALNHRFRRLRAQAVIVREGRKTGLDAKDIVDDSELPVTQEAVDRQNIAKYFGQSTADGIQFQFRTIKKDASLLRQVERDGGDVVNCLNFGTPVASPFKTPLKPTPSREGASRSATGTGRKRARAVEIKRSSSDEEDDAEDIANYSDMDCSPSKRPNNAAAPSQKPRTPSRPAATKASATIAAATAADTSASEDLDEAEFRTPTVSSRFVVLDSPPTASSVKTRTASIFGPFIGDKPVNGGSRAATASQDLSDDEGPAQPPPRFLYNDMADGEC